MKRKKHTTKKRQDVRREDNNNNKRTTKNKANNRNTDLRGNSLGPKPSFLFAFFCWCFFHVEKESCFPWERGYFCWFLSLPYVLPSLSHFPFSLSLSILLFSCFFLPRFIFSVFFFLCFFAFVSCREEHQGIRSERFISSIFILFCWFLVFV